jgi:hypothetical protein
VSLDALDALAKLWADGATLSEIERATGVTRASPEGPPAAFVPALAASAPIARAEDRSSPPPPVSAASESKWPRDPRPPMATLDGCTV